MIWKATTTTPGHVIIINYIAATTSLSFFDGSTPVTGLAYGEYGLNTTSGTPSEEMPYLIYFQIEVSGTLMPQEYFTDPKIRIR